MKYLFIEEGLEKIKISCEKRRLKNPSVAEQWRQNPDIGMVQMWRSSGLGKAFRRLLSVTIQWQAYIQLTDVEAAFRIQKSDQVLRLIWHQKEERVQAHILVCFLAFVLWKCLAQMCKQNGLGNEPRKVIDEISPIKLTDVILPTRKGIEIKLHCVSKPDKYQQILLQHLGLKIPSRLTKNLKM